MDSSIRNQPTADGTSINLEILASEKGLENGAECVSSTNETVRVNVFPAHLRETSFDIWLHSSKKEITDPISNGIVSSRGTMASSADGLISSFVDIELKKADVDDLLTEHHKSKDLFEERSLASERPSSPSSSKSFEVLAWVVNQEQSPNEHQLKRLDSLDIDMDGHSTGRIMNKSNSQENCFHSSDSFSASEISYVDNAVQFDSENDFRSAQGQELKMVNRCNSTCNENLRKQSASTSCLTQPLLKSILDAMETKFEAFRRIIKAELGGPDSPPKWFLEYMEVEKLKENFESHAEQQATKIRLQNALTELETTRAEMVKVQKESVRNTAIDWTAITSLRNELNRVQNELALESSKHTEEISTFEKENAATAHALEKIQKEARLLKSSLESSLSENEGALVQLQKTKGQLEEALDRESSLKLQLEELQNHLSAMVKKKDEDSYKHAKDISSLEERNTATVHALEEALCRENALKIELEKLQNELCAVTDEKDKKEHSQVPVQDVTLPSYVAEKEETIEVAEVSTSQVFNSKILSNPVLPVEPIAFVVEFQKNY